MIEKVITIALMLTVISSLLTLCAVVFIFGKVFISQEYSRPFKKPEIKRNRRISQEERIFAAELENIDNYGTDKPQKDIL